MKGNEKLLDIEDSISVSAVTVFELMWAAEPKGESIAITTKRFLCNIRVFKMDSSIAFIAAHGRAELLKKGLEKHMPDLVIAATANKYSLRLITFDTDFIDITKAIPIIFDYYQY